MSAVAVKFIGRGEQCTFEDFVDARGRWRYSDVEYREALVAQRLAKYGGPGYLGGEKRPVG